MKRGRILREFPRRSTNGFLDTLRGMREASFGLAGHVQCRRNDNTFCAPVEDIFIICRISRISPTGARVSPTGARVSPTGARLSKISPTGACFRVSSSVFQGSSGLIKNHLHSAPRARCACGQKQNAARGRRLRVAPASYRDLVLGFAPTTKRQRHHRLRVLQLHDSVPVVEVCGSTCRQWPSEARPRAALDGGESPPAGPTGAGGDWNAVVDDVVFQSRVYDVPYWLQALAFMRNGGVAVLDVLLCIAISRSGEIMKCLPHPYRCFLMKIAKHFLLFLPLRWMLCSVRMSVRFVLR